MLKQNLHDSPLGKANTYVSEYSPDLLFPIDRNNTRSELGIDLVKLPFQGQDFWTAFEVSWLNDKGKPTAMIAEFTIPCTSPRLIESKSFKQYLNSFNGTKFVSIDAVKNKLITDLSKATGGVVSVNLIAPKDLPLTLNQTPGINIDDLDVTCDTYHVHADYLKVEDEDVTEVLSSELLKSNCPVTGQPDWASLQISYTGKKINREALLKYIVSYRDHDGFHEDCVERMFADISKMCKPEKLLVYARYSRRGGLDINPYRANYDIKVNNQRFYRQ